MELRLDRNLYSREAVMDGVDAFAELAKIRLEPGESEQHVLFFDDIDEDFEDRLIDEFANYCLGLTVEGGVNER